MGETVEKYESLEHLLGIEDPMVFRYLSHKIEDTFEDEYPYQFILNYSLSIHTASQPYTIEIKVDSLGSVVDLCQEITELEAKYKGADQ